MLKKSIYLVVFAAVMVLMTSCGAYKRLGYFQDMSPDVAYDMPQQPEAIIAKGDQLNISVYCSTPALAAPFNLATGVSAVDPSAVTAGADAVAKASESGSNYEVDGAGDINFPVFGKIHVEGETLKWLKEHIEGLLIERKFIKDPVVITEFTNFKYTLVGEIASGVHYVPSGKINIFDAIAEAGEPLETGMRNEVCVIRTVDGKRRMYTIDLTSKDCFYSPVYYLQQNDMVYVKPLKGKHDAIISQNLNVVSSATSLVTSLVNTFLWFKVYLTK